VTKNIPKSVLTINFHTQARYHSNIGLEFSAYICLNKINLETMLYALFSMIAIKGRNELLISNIYFTILYLITIRLY